MKTLCLMLLLLSSIASAQVSRETFLRLSDERKTQFLDQHAQEKELTSRERRTALVKRLSETALAQAEVWEDTVLEGPYAQTGEAKIVSAVAMLVNKQIYAYRFTISAEAIFTEADGCEYGDNTEEWSEACYESAGHISETVSFDFNGEIFEDGSYADFEN